MGPEPVKVEQKFDDIRLEDILENDILIEYPTTSFDVYLQLLSLASTNKDVSGIYISLYRIGNNPTIYSILRRAVDNGVKVHVNIELCASGEFINQKWADEMIKAGIKVTTYATGKIKVHSKLTLIQFNDGNAISQIGTGNYHTQTTSQYTDLSLMTSNPDICKQVRDVFRILDGKKNKISFNKNLLVTRYNARNELIKLIKRETRLGSNGYIVFKCNALDDKEINKYLDEAAQANCQIDLIVRGVCTWIPDQLGYNVRIKSIVWDKLEHSRVYCFGSVNPTIYLGSLDLITTKLNNRIETLVRILDSDILADLCDYLNHYITNASNSWILLRSGGYRKEEI
jgi:polyphosphate kinase